LLHFVPDKSTRIVEVPFGPVNGKLQRIGHLRLIFAPRSGAARVRMVASEPAMLRAGLVGLPSSGKTTLFQLLTSAREAARSHGKTEANVGVSRVADDRLDRLSALFQPKKHTPATVEFADMAAGRGDAASLLDVVAYRNADALLHVVRTFDDPALPHPKG